MHIAKVMQKRKRCKERWVDKESERENMNRRKKEEERRKEHEENEDMKEKKE